MAQNKSISVTSKRGKNKKYDSSSDKALGKRITKRIGFHLKAVGTALLTGLAASVLVDKTGMASEIVGGLTITTYFSLLLLKPYNLFSNKNKFAAFCSAIAAGACFLGGFWQGAAIAGIVAASINTFSEKFKFGVIFPTLISLVVLGVYKMPSIYYLIAVVIALIGTGIAKKFIPQDSNLPLPSHTSDNLTFTEQQTTNIETKYTEHLQTLEELGKLKRQLPIKQQIYLEHIQEKTHLILQCMEDDPRDTQPGDRFLSRYLPITLTCVQQQTKVFAPGYKAEQFQQAQEQAQHALLDLANAFTQMHQRLLENDLDDVVADLNVLDKLLKSEGFDKVKR